MTTSGNRGRPPLYESPSERSIAKNARRREARKNQREVETACMSQQEASKQNDEISYLRSELLQVRADMDNALMKVAALEEKCSSQQDQLKNLNYQLATANEKLKRADLTSAKTLQENEVKERTLNEMNIYITDLKHQLVEAEKLRKELHNTIMELKGNIRVFCRVRPTLDGGGGMVVSYPTDIENLGRGIELMRNDKKISFTLDKVFDHEASQENVFVEISQLVQNALDGYKVCIFAYGQTGSGKTYTMMGKPEDHEEKGLIPRVLQQLFEASQSLKSQGWRYNMQVSMLEIYTETIRDLLPLNRCANSHGSIKKESTIRHDPSGNTHVSDISVVDVYRIDEVYDLLNRASQNRSVGKTQMNEQSSRSHFVFTLRISGVNDFTKQQVQGILNLIDLAGSERLAKSGATGACLKETQAINKSLSTLNLVIVSIAKKEGHVPYRNSKLTWLLQPCLSGDSKILMFVNISPEVSSASESICSLQFAEGLNAYQISAPRRHTKSK